MTDHKTLALAKYIYFGAPVNNLKEHTITQEHGKKSEGTKQQETITYLESSQEQDASTSVRQQQRCSGRGLTLAWLMIRPTNVDTSMDRDTEELLRRRSDLSRGKAAGSSGTVTV